MSSLVTQSAIKAAQKKAKEELKIPIGPGKRVPEDKLDAWNKRWKSIVVRTHANFKRTRASHSFSPCDEVCGLLQGEKNLPEGSNGGSANSDDGDAGDHTQDRKAMSKSKVGSN